MSTQTLLPPIPKPPHDPTWWLLDARIGWREAALLNVEKAPGSGSLAISPLPGSGPSLVDKSGSFGGLTLPTNVALGPDGSVYLLDTKAIDLKRFDPCECRFEPVPCFGGKGQAPRQLLDPYGIGIRGGNLFVCDTGNHRLSVFSLHGFVLRSFWAPPDVAGLSNTWEPYAVAFDGKGRVFVSDGANGCIHRFSPSGRWETCLTGFGKATHIAIDCDDRLYVVVEGEESVRVVTGEGQPLGTASRLEELAPRFSELPFQVDTLGHLYLAGLCERSGRQACDKSRTSNASGVFDLFGNPTKTPSNLGLPLYMKQGMYITEALDSKLYQCQWHRVILRGEITSGARIQVSTYTAETSQPIEHVLNLPEAAWETNQSANQMDDCEWDCLVRSGGGRYLWLRLQFRGNGMVTPVIENVRVEFPRISLRRYLPAVFGKDPISADVTDRLLSIFDTTLRSIESKIDNQASYFDPLSAPTDPDFLSWLASWIGLILDRNWPEAKRRLFLKRAARLYHIRGTRVGLWRQLLLYLGMEPESKCCPDDRPRTRCRLRPTNCALIKKLPCAWQPPPLILEHYQLRRWLFVGAGRLGEQAMLWGKHIVNRSQLDAGAQVGRSQIITTQDPLRDPFHVYAHKFSVFVPAVYGKSDRYKKALENLLNIEKPSQTYAQVEYVEPRFRIGFQSMIGFDSVIGRYPEGVELNGMPLGQATVLGKPPYKQVGPSMEIGKQARIGTTTKLD